MKMQCPCCAGAGWIEESDAQLLLTPLQLKIYQIVRNTPGGIECKRLIDQCYGHRYDGGPDFADKTVHVTINHMNKRLATFGEAVKANKRGQGAVYRLHRNVV